VPGVERPNVDAGPERHEESSALVDMIASRKNLLAAERRHAQGGPTPAREPNLSHRSAGAG